MAVASHLTRPTRSSNDPGRVSLLTWPCSDWGLPCRACCQTRGGLLPHRFTLTLGQRAVCFLWPYPSPCGAQVLPGSLPCGARTFLSIPFQLACRDHHALPPPGDKGTGAGRVGASLACQAADQAGQRVDRDPPALRTPAAPPGPAIFRGEPEAVVVLENDALEPRPVTRPQRRRHQHDGVHQVQAADRKSTRL